MTYYDEQLQALQTQCSRKRQLETRIRELCSQQDVLRPRAQELEAALQKEQADVEKLEGRSLAVFFYNVIGSRERKLTQEREEAYAAQVKYDAVAKELREVETEQQAIRAEFAQLGDCDGRYQTLLKEKAAAVKAAGGSGAAEILALEEQLAWLESHKRELWEATRVGKDALATTKEVLQELASAKRCSTWDLLGGGILADVAKHGYLDNAQMAIETLQGQLRQFKTELADVTIQAEVEVNVHGFLFFADYFYDGLFADLAVREKIVNSQAKMETTQSQIQEVLEQLWTKSREAARAMEETRAKLDELVLAAKL